LSTKLSLNQITEMVLLIAAEEDLAGPMVMKEEEDQGL
jgi:hypothetical protein